MGPVTYMVVEFPGIKFKGEIVPALNELVDAGTIRIMDMLVVTKDADGVVAPYEISDLKNPEVAALFKGLKAEVSGLFNEDDIAILASTLDNNSAAGLLLFENRWAEKFTNAISNAEGRFVLLESVPADVLAEALAAQA